MEIGRTDKVEYHSISAPSLLNTYQDDAFLAELEYLTLYLSIWLQSNENS